MERDIARSEEAVDRYLSAFESGTMDEDVCSPRVRKPELPDTGVLDTLRADIQAATDAGSPETLRAIMRTFVHRVDIIGRDQAKPIFVIPGGGIPPQRAAATAETVVADRKVRALAGPVPWAGLEPAAKSLEGSCSIR